MNRINKSMIAPCGMNCALCSMHQRKESKRQRHCPGCFDPKVSACARCVICKCPVILKNKSGFCYECDKFPCRRLRQLDERYRKNYRMSMLKNLETIRSEGLDAFFRHEEERWRCPQCGNLFCVHTENCLTCGHEKP